MHLLDWLACVAGARRSEVAGVLRHCEMTGTARAGWLGGVLEMDDVHRSALLHPGPVIWSVALEAARAVPLPFDAMLDAAVRGYEAMIAIGATFDERHYAHFHNTATAGPFGAAAAAGSLFGLDPDQLVAALGNAGSTTGGLWQMRHEGGMTKQWHVAHAGRSGLLAAEMAARGLTGTATVLEGPQGLYAATCKHPRPLAAHDNWQIHDVSFKPWAACRHAHPAIDCALELRALGRLSPPFHVETYADAVTFCDRPEPASEIEARFSIQHAVAVVASGRDVKPGDFSPDAVTRLADLRKQVTVTEDPELSARYPGHFGARLNGLELADARGDPERPVGVETIVSKMHTLADWGGLGAAEAHRACSLALEQDDLPAVCGMLEEWLR